MTRDNLQSIATGIVAVIIITLVFWTLNAQASIFGQLDCSPLEDTGDVRVTKCQSSLDIGKEVQIHIKGTPKPSWKLVYTRQPRHNTPITGKESDQKRNIDDASNWQTVNDIGRFWRQSESDVVLDDLKGNIRIVHDCTGQDRICTAQEARVSPDGKRIAYAVSEAPLNATKWPVPMSYSVMDGSWARRTTPREVFVKDPNSGKEYSVPWEFDTQKSRIWIHDIEGNVSYPVTGGHRDRSPDWLDNETLTFVSDRAGTYSAVSTQNRNFYPGPATLLHRGKLVGKSLADVTQISHDFNAMSPEVMTDGEICYSNYQGVSPREFGSTPQNHWWPVCTDINGNGWDALLGAHGSPAMAMWEYVKDWMDPKRRGEHSTEFRGLRAMGEIFPQYMAVSNYYRSNSLGAMGSIWGFTKTDHEGCSIAANIEGSSDKSALEGSGRFAPCDLINLTPWAQDQDQSSPKYALDGRATGRAGYPAASDGDGWLFTWCRGWCYSPSWPGMATYKAMGGEPPAKKVIAKAKVRQVTNPFDPAQVEVIACSSLVPGEDYHCWDARSISTYREKFGIEKPQIADIQPPTSECFLNVVDARDSELLPIPGKEDQKSRIAFQGNAHPAYASLVTHFKAIPLEHWKSKPTREGLFKTSPPLRAPLNDDGSVRLPVPCGTPLQHAGTDSTGNTIAEGLAPIWTFSELTCHGCHAGHSKERAFSESPEERFKETQAYKNGE